MHLADEVVHLRQRLRRLVHDEVDARRRAPRARASVTSTAISTIRAARTSRPVISRSIQTRRSSALAGASGTGSRYRSQRHGDDDDGGMTSVRNVKSTVLSGPRVELRPLRSSDFGDWRDVRTRSRDWLEPWEPLAEPGQPRSRHRPRGVPRPLRRLGAPTALRHRVRVRLLPPRRLVHRRGEPRERPARAVPVGVRRLLDRRHARGAAATSPKASRSSCDTGSRSLACTASRRRSSHGTPPAGASRDKLGLRDEGLAERFLQIRGVWEDHVRYAITSEEWDVRRDEITRRFLT